MTVLNLAWYDVTTAIDKTSPNPPPYKLLVDRFDENILRNRDFFVREEGINPIELWVYGDGGVNITNITTAGYTEGQTVPSTVTVDCDINPLYEFVSITDYVTGIPVNTDPLPYVFTLSTSTRLQINIRRRDEGIVRIKAHWINDPDFPAWSEEKSLDVTVAKGTNVFELLPILQTGAVVIGWYKWDGVRWYSTAQPTYNFELLNLQDDLEVWIRAEKIEDEPETFTVDLVNRTNNGLILDIVLDGVSTGAAYGVFPVGTKIQIEGTAPATTEFDHWTLLSEINEVGATPNVYDNPFIVTEYLDRDYCFGCYFKSTNPTDQYIVLYGNGYIAEDSNNGYFFNDPYDVMAFAGTDNWTLPAPAAIYGYEYSHTYWLKSDNAFSSRERLDPRVINTFNSQLQGAGIYFVVNVYKLSRLPKLYKISVTLRLGDEVRNQFFELYKEVYENQPYTLYAIPRLNYQPYMLRDKKTNQEYYFYSGSTTRTFDGVDVLTRDRDFELSYIDASDYTLRFEILNSSTDGVSVSGSPILWQGTTQNTLDANVEFRFNNQWRLAKYFFDRGLAVIPCIEGTDYVVVLNSRGFEQITWKNKTSLLIKVLFENDQNTSFYNLRIVAGDGCAWVSSDNNIVGQPITLPFTVGKLRLVPNVYGAAFLGWWRIDGPYNELYTTSSNFPTSVTIDKNFTLYARFELNAVTPSYRRVRLYNNPVGLGTLYFNNTTNTANTWYAVDGRYEIQIV